MIAGIICCGIWPYRLLSEYSLKGAKPWVERFLYPHLVSGRVNAQQLKDVPHENDNRRSFCKNAPNARH